MSIAKTLFVLSTVFPFFLLGGCSSGTIPVPPTPGSRYVLTDINASMTYVSGGAVAVNDQGQVIGSISYGGGEATAVITQGFLYSSSASTTLPLLPSGINNTGQVVGSRGLYQNGALTDLSKQSGLSSTDFADPADINNPGQIVGRLVMQAIYPPDHMPQGATTISHAFSLQNGQVTDLGTLGEVGDNNPDHASNSSAGAVNDMGVIVGQSGTGQYAQTGRIKNHAFVYSGGKMTDLNTLGGDTSQAVAINNQGQIVGYADTVGALVYPPTVTDHNGQPVTSPPYYQSGPSHAVMWQMG